MAVSVKKVLKFCSFLTILTTSVSCMLICTPSKLIVVVMKRGKKSTSGFFSPASIKFLQRSLCFLISLS